MRSWSHNWHKQRYNYGCPAHPVPPKTAERSPTSLNASAEMPAASCMQLSIPGQRQNRASRCQNCSRNSRPAHRRRNVLCGWLGQNALRGTALGRQAHERQWKLASKSTTCSSSNHEYIMSRRKERQESRQKFGVESACGEKRSGPCEFRYLSPLGTRIFFSFLYFVLKNDEKLTRN